MDKSIIVNNTTLTFKIVKKEITPVSALKENPKNPRKIDKKALHKLARNLKEHSSFLELRPLIVDAETNVVLAGNMRLRAARLANIDYVPALFITADETVKNQIMILDNVNYGRWDFSTLFDISDTLKNLADVLPVSLRNIGLEFTLNEKPKHTFTQDYVPTDAAAPSVNELYNTDKYEALMHEIENANIDISVKDFLRFAATRFIVFNYSKIAEFYAHETNPIVRELFKKLALVIVDYNTAEKNSFVTLHEKIRQVLLPTTDDDEIL